jgi:hypothetical protein
MTPGLEQYCQGGQAGLVVIEYVYLKDVDPDSLFAIVNNEYLRPYEVLLLDGDWQTLPTIPTPSWQETENKSQQGSSYANQLQVRTRQLSAGASGVFDSLSRRRLLLRITDGSNVKWVVGNKEQGFNLSFKRNAGGGGGFAGYDVTLRGETSHSVAQAMPF